MWLAAAAISFSWVMVTSPTPATSFKRNPGPVKVFGTAS
jgi:hypothetical protein